MPRRVDGRVLLGSRNSRSRLINTVGKRPVWLRWPHQLSAMKQAGDPSILFALLKIEKTVKHFSAHRQL